MQLRGNRGAQKHFSIDISWGEVFSNQNQDTSKYIGLFPFSQVRFFLCGVFFWHLRSKHMREKSCSLQSYVHIDHCLSVNPSTTYHQGSTRWVLKGAIHHVDQERAGVRWMIVNAFATISDIAKARSTLDSKVYIYIYIRTHVSVTSKITKLCP